MHNNDRATRCSMSCGRTSSGNVFLNGDFHRSGTHVGVRVDGCVFSISTGLDFHCAGDRRPRCDLHRVCGDSPLVPICSRGRGCNCTLTNGVKLPTSGGMVTSRRFHRTTAGGFCAGTGMSLNMGLASFLGLGADCTCHNARCHCARRCPSFASGTRSPGLCPCSCRKACC